MAFGDILAVGQTNDRIYRYNGTSWDTGLPVPTTETFPRSVAVDPANGNILLLSSNRVFRYNGTSWDAGFPVPTAETISTGVTVDPSNGNILILGRAQDRVYRHNGTMWDSGLRIPTAETVPWGVAIDPSNSDILAAGVRNARIYRHNGTSWDAGFTVPTVAGVTVGIAGIAIDPSNSDILAASSTNNRIYRHNGTSWDTGMPVPTAEKILRGVAVDGFRPGVDAGPVAWGMEVPEAFLGQVFPTDPADAAWSVSAPQPDPSAQFTASAGSVAWTLAVPEPDPSAQFTASAGSVAWTVSAPQPDPSAQSTASAGSVAWTLAVPEPEVSHTVAAPGPAEWLFAIPQATVDSGNPSREATEPVVMTSRTVFRNAFSDETVGGGEGYWDHDSSGRQSGIRNTGPGTNNPLAYAYTNTSLQSPFSSADVVSANGIARFTNVPAEEQRTLHMRICIQGGFGVAGLDGLQVQHRTGTTGSWTQTALLRGWAYANTYTAGDTITDAAGTDLTCAADGGWVDVEVTIPDTADQVRLYPRYNTPNGLGDRIVRSVSLRQFHWEYQAGVDAGPVAWGMEVPEAFLGQVFPTDPADAAWSVSAPQPEVLPTRRRDAGSVAWTVSAPEPDPSAQFTASAGSVAWTVSAPEPDPSAQFTASAGSVAWTLAVPEPTVMRARGRDPGDVAWSVALPRPAIAKETVGYPATPAVWSVALPRPAVQRTRVVLRSQWDMAVPDPRTVRGIHVANVVSDPITFSDIDNDFRRALAGGRRGNGSWVFTATGSTPTAGTGPGTNNVLAFVHTETSDSDDLTNMASNANARIRSTPAGRGRILHLRLCLQGTFRDPSEGLWVQQRAAQGDAWQDLTLMRGWAYADNYTTGQTIDDFGGRERTVAADGGWVDFAVPIPDGAGQVRLHPIYAGADSGSTDTHDVALQHLYWEIPGAVAFWAAALSQPVPERTRFTDPTPARWLMSLPQAEGSRARRRAARAAAWVLALPAPETLRGRTRAATVAAWVLDVPEPGITLDTVGYEADPATWDMAVPEPVAVRSLVRYTSAWVLALPAPETLRGRTRAATVAAWVLDVPEPGITLETVGYEADPATWDMAVPEPEPLPTRRRAAVPVVWAMVLPEPGVFKAKTVNPTPVRWTFRLPRPGGEVTMLNMLAFGDLLLLERTDQRVYLQRNGRWSHDEPLPARLDGPTGLAIDPLVGTPVLVNAGTATTLHRYAGGWDMGIDFPDGVTAVVGAAIHPRTGTVSVIDTDTHQIVERERVRWRDGTAGPNNETNMVDLAYWSDGTLLVMGQDTAAIHARTEGGWRRVAGLPSADTFTGFAVEPYRDRPVVFDNTNDRMYLLNQGRWELVDGPDFGMGGHDAVVMGYNRHSALVTWPDNLVAQPPLLATAAQDGENTLILSWRTDANALRYEHSLVRDGEPVRWESIPTTTRQVRFRGLLPHRTYRAAVRAVTESGPQAASSVEHTMRPNLPAIVIPANAVRIPMEDEDRQSLILRLDGRDVRLTVVWSPTSVLGETDGHWQGTLEVPVNTFVVRGMRLTLNSGLLSSVQGHLNGDLRVRSLVGGHAEPLRDAWSVPTHAIYWEPG